MQGNLKERLPGATEEKNLLKWQNTLLTLRIVSVA